MINLINRVIKRDLSSQTSFTVIDDKPVLKVIKNTNILDKEPFEGICPEGLYVVLAELKGMPINITFETKQVRVSRNGHYIIEEMPTI